MRQLTTSSRLLPSLLSAPDRMDLACDRQRRKLITEALRFTTVAYPVTEALPGVKSHRLVQMISDGKGGTEECHATHWFTT